MSEYYVNEKYQLRTLPEGYKHPTWKPLSFYSKKKLCRVGDIVGLRSIAHACLQLMFGTLGNSRHDKAYKERYRVEGVSSVVSRKSHPELGYEVSLVSLKGGRHITIFSCAVKVLERAGSKKDKKKNWEEYSKLIDEVRRVAEGQSFRVYAETSASDGTCYLGVVDFGEE